MMGNWYKFRNKNVDILFTSEHSQKFWKQNDLKIEKNKTCKNKTIWHPIKVDGFMTRETFGNLFLLTFLMM
jgi:hypothetical protein